eukprot:TRINITY_DN6281_c0_g1_i1.p1 TRINITY_DN6281_c0_g1~~TRINITY_DN6281_c0_g1_i1.p1  ORF type:complete len:177 (-),score=26.65 TRINITY_DN6281_c0_g1_i1:53-583(-)
MSEEEQAQASVAMFHALSKLLVLGMPTICAINGHAYGAGFYLALCHDYRVMRSDKGWVCIPAANLGITLPPSLIELARAKLPGTVLREVLLEGRRYTGAEAAAAGLVDISVSNTELGVVARKIALEKGANSSKSGGAVLSTFKQRVYRTPHQLLTGDTQPIDVSRTNTTTRNKANL